MVVAAVPMPPPIPMRRMVVLESEPEFLAKYMPAIFRQDPFMQRLLRMFDEMLMPLLETVDAVDCYFDPLMTPPAFVDWLASWVGEELSPAWPDRSRRALVSEAAWIHRARGTQAGIKRAVELVAGCEALVIDNTEGLRLDEDGRLGVNTALQASNQNRIKIVLRGSAADIDLEAVNDVVRKLKPAHCVFSVELADA
jgi:phage tail-like protein